MNKEYLSPRDITESESEKVYRVYAQYIPVSWSYKISQICVICAFPCGILECHERLLQKSSGLIGKINVIPALLVSKKIKLLKRKC